ncbi:MAG TPA: GatB/YqeY domain-containing protein [Bacteroidales bacterium]
MELEKLINNDLKQAMLARDKEKLDALRAIKAALLLEKTGKDVTSLEIPDEVEVQLLAKLIKQRKAAVEIYTAQNRQDLADVELFQISIIEKYLPQQISEVELRNVIKDVIVSVGATSVKDMGKVMAAATKSLAGKAENKMISNIIKELLSS